MSEPNLTLLQAACDLGVSLATARRLVRSGRLLAIKVRTGYEDRGQWEVPHGAITQFREAFANFERFERRERPAPELSELAERPKPEGSGLRKRRELEERTIPLSVHMATLEALERADRRFEDKVRLAADRLRLAEELRERAELAERARMSLEYELRSYQLALAENAGSLAEERALRQAAEASAMLMSAVVVPDLKTDTPTPKRGWGQRLGRWLLGQKTG